MTAPILGSVRIGVDTGGMFTDAVLVRSAAEGTAPIGLGKTLSTSGNLIVGALASVEAAAVDLGLTAREVLSQTESVDYATTVGLNALLTASGAPIGLIPTEGFKATLPVARTAKVEGLSPAEATEHDGIHDKVYEIGLTMTKQGDSLHLDFTDASPQAPR